MDHQDKGSSSRDDTERADGEELTTAVSLTPRILDMSDFDIPGCVDAVTTDAVRVNIRDYANLYAIRYDEMLDRICMLMAIHGTSPLVSPDVGFRVVGKDGRTLLAKHGDVAAVLRAGAPTHTLRQIMRSFADRTRKLLTYNMQVEPLLVRRYRHPQFNTGFDFADGCKDPPLEAHVSALLLGYRELALGESPRDRPSTPRY